MWNQEIHLYRLSMEIKLIKGKEIGDFKERFLYNTLLTIFEHAEFLLILFLSAVFWVHKLNTRQQSFVFFVCTPC